MEMGKKLNSEDFCIDGVHRRSKHSGFGRSSCYFNVLQVHGALCCWLHLAFETCVICLSKNK